MPVKVISVYDILTIHVSNFVEDLENCCRVRDISC